MLNYIKKVVTPDKNVETYEIGYQGGAFTFSTDTNLLSFLYHIEKDLKEEIEANKVQIAQLEAECANSKEKKILKSPILFQYNRSNKKLESELDLLLRFINYLNGLKIGKRDDSSIFSEACHDNPVSFARRVGIHLGSKPRTVRELSVYRGILDRKIDAADLKRQKYQERRLSAYPLYTLGTPGEPIKPTEENIKEIYDIRLQGLASNVDNLRKLTDERDEALAEAWSFVSGKLDSIEPIATYQKHYDPESEVDERKVYELRQQVIDMDKDYNPAYEGSYFAHYALEEAENEYNAFVDNNFRTRRAIIEDIVNYDLDLAQERYQERIIAEFREKGTSYTRKYRAK